MPPAAQIVLSFREARQRVQQAADDVRPTETEICELLLCGGRVLAETVLADRDFPPFPRATRDGFALRSADVVTTPARLRVVGEVRAGGPPSSQEISAGQCVEIMTGAPVLTSADAVVMVEYTRRDGEMVEIQRPVARGENVVPTGAEARSREVLLRPATRLTPAAIALAGSCGRHELKIHKRPQVAILSTGDELVDVAAEPAANQIRNSNSYSLAAQVQRAGGQPVVLPIAPDDPAPLRRLIQEGLATDLLLLSGGVSMGKYDLVEQVLEELGAQFFFAGAHIQPGRPIVFGAAPARKGAIPTCFFGLPGNPVSTMVCFELFARVMVEALAGIAPQPLRYLQVRLKSEVRIKTGLTRFLPAALSGEYELAEVELVKWQGSGDMAATARANCLLVVPPDRERMAAGDMVSILPL
ncbi:MAG: molybdopterin molybdotransferase MoeA [Terriglobales bacterium]